MKQLSPISRSAPTSPKGRMLPLRGLGGLLILFLFAATSFAQTVRTKTPVTGVGELRFGIAREELAKSLLHHSVDSTKITDIPGYPLTAAHIELAGHVFETCSFSFNDKGLQIIVLSKSIVDEDKTAGVYSDLLSVLERDYGRQSDRRGRRSRLKDSYSWNDPQFNTIMLSKEYDNKEQKTKISIYARSR